MVIWVFRIGEWQSWKLYIPRLAHCTSLQTLVVCVHAVLESEHLPVERRPWIRAITLLGLVPSSLLNLRLVITGEAYVFAAQFEETEQRWPIELTLKRFPWLKTLHVTIGLEEDEGDGSMDCGEIRYLMEQAMPSTSKSGILTMRTLPWPGLY